MGHVEASVLVPGLASAAETLWYDPVRWAAWVDGFGHVVEVAPEWPASGHAIWNSAPGGRQRVLARVTAYEPRGGQTLALEDAQIRGTQRVAFTPGPEHTRVTLALDYEIKQRTPVPWLLDALFVRRAQAASLRRTLDRFAYERRGDIELDAVTSR